MAVFSFALSVEKLLCYLVSVTLNRHMVPGLIWFVRKLPPYDGPEWKCIQAYGYICLITCKWREDVFYLRSFIKLAEQMTCMKSSELPERCVVISSHGMVLLLLSGFWHERKNRSIYLYFFLSELKISLWCQRFTKTNPVALFSSGWWPNCWN